MGWLSKLFNLELESKESSRPYSTGFGRNTGSGTAFKQGVGSGKQGEGSKSDAYNRLKLVLMHDRTQISPDVLSKMRDELVQVISKYVDIDREALELNLETESNTIALVANIPVMRMKPSAVSTSDAPSESVSSSPSSVNESLEANVTQTTTPETKPTAVSSQVSQGTVVLEQTTAETTASEAPAVSVSPTAPVTPLAVKSSVTATSPTAPPNVKPSNPFGAAPVVKSPVTATSPTAPATSTSKTPAIPTP